MPINIADVVAAQGDTLTAEPVTIERIIAHIVGSDEKNAPVRAKIAGEAGGIEASGQELINAMATMGMAKAKVLDAEHQTKLAQEQLVAQRYRQIGIDMQNPADDRLAKMTAALQQQQDAALASQQKIQQLDAVGFADNPIQWFLNQYAIDSEKETLTRTAGVANQLATQLGQMHTLAQENVQSIVTSKLAKTDSELLAAKEEIANLALADLQKAKMETGGASIRALSAVLQANEQEQSVMWKALATVKDKVERDRLERDRERDAEKERMQLEMLRLQLSKLGDEVADKKALIADMKQFAVNELGSKKEQVAALPNEAVLNNKPLQEAYFAARGATGPQGPYSALTSIEANSAPDSIFQNTRPAHWIREKLNTITKPVEIKREKEEHDFYNQALIQAAKAELAGDADLSTLYRLPYVGELRQVPAIANTQLFKRYVSTAPDTARYSFKQIIGFALKDPAIKTNGNMRGQLVKDIVTIAQTTNNVISEGYFLSKYGLPAPQSFGKEGGYKIAPKELLEAANGKLPESTKKRFFDLTKASDVQLLINIAITPTQSNLLMPELFNFGGTDMGGSLRATDPIYNQSVGKPAPTPKKK